MIENLLKEDMTERERDVLLSELRGEESNALCPDVDAFTIEGASKRSLTQFMLEVTATEQHRLSGAIPLSGIRIIEITP